MLVNLFHLGLRNLRMKITDRGSNNCCKKTNHHQLVVWELLWQWLPWKCRGVTQQQEVLEKDILTHDIVLSKTDFLKNRLQNSRN